MPRVSLNPELRVQTTVPVAERSLGELPTALGIDVFPRAPQKRHEFEVPETTALTTAPARKPRPVLKPELRVTRDKTGKAVAKAPTHDLPTAETSLAFDQDKYFDAAQSRVKKTATWAHDETITGMEYKPRSVGRPGEYTKKFPTIAFNFALLGLNDERIAQAMGVSDVTFNNWKNDHPEFLQALVDGRENVDGLVINAVFRKAVGFTYDAVKIFHNKDDGTVYAPYQEYVPPDVGAAKYFLGIRRGKLRKDGWEDTTETNAPPPAVQVNINVTDPQEAAKQYRAFIQGEAV